MIEPQKTLVLVRHAKSSWQDSSLTDHERPLNERGTRDAPRMALRLASRGVQPDHIISSSATRALTTAQVFAAQFRLEPEGLVANEVLYGASPDEVMELIRAIDAEWECVALVGHNPTFTELANKLTASVIGHLPTCAVVTLALDSRRWLDVKASQLRLLDFDFPKKDRR